MNNFQNIWENTLDLLFPKNQKIIELEHLEWQDLRSKLPRSQNSLSSQDIFSLFDYRNEKVRDIVWNIKYKRNLRLIEALAKLLHEEMLETIADIELFDGGMPSLLIPIPMSEKRRHERGFNQTELLASAIHTLSNASLNYDPALLIKTRHTKPQAELTRSERLENLKDAFSLTTPDLIAGHNIILIDDVSTTGATICEAANTLKHSGARKVIAFTIAH